MVFIMQLVLQEEGRLKIGVFPDVYQQGGIKQKGERYYTWVSLARHEKIFTRVCLSSIFRWKRPKGTLPQWKHRATAGTKSWLPTSMLSQFLRILPIFDCKWPTPTGCWECFFIDSTISKWCAQSCKVWASVK